MSTLRRRTVLVLCLAMFCLAIIGAGAIVGGHWSESSSSGNEAEQQRGGLEVVDLNGGSSGVYGSGEAAAAHLRVLTGERLRLLSKGEGDEIAALKGICADTDTVLSGDLGAGPENPQVYFEAQVAVLEARADAIHELAAQTDREELKQYSELLAKLYPAMRAAGFEPSARPSGEVQEISLEIARLEAALGNPCP